MKILKYSLLAFVCIASCKQRTFNSNLQSLSKIEKESNKVPLESFSLGFAKSAGIEHKSFQETFAKIKNATDDPDKSNLSEIL